MFVAYLDPSMLIALKCNASELVHFCLSPSLFGLSNQYMLTKRLVIIGGYPHPIVLDLNSIESMILEPDIFRGLAFDIHKTPQCYIPIDVAPASRLFSTNSLTTEQMSTMTCPDWIWWTYPQVSVNSLRDIMETYSTTFNGLDGGHTRSSAHRSFDIWRADAFRWPHATRS